MMFLVLLRNSIEYYFKTNNSKYILYIIYLKYETTREGNKCIKVNIFIDKLHILQ